MNESNILVDLPDVNAKILCTWLGLEDKQWPPDHHALLGVRHGETDQALIEKTVQARMAKLRVYQLSHPEEATEGMNRVAQAFITLTEAAARQTRRSKPSVVATASLPGKSGNGWKNSTKELTRPAAKSTNDDTLLLNQTEVNWKQMPPPVRPGAEKSTPIASLVPPMMPGPASPSPPPDGVIINDATEVLVRKEVVQAAALSAPLAPDGTPLTIEIAQQSPEALRGLGTMPAIIDRIYLTRHLLTAWKKIGGFLAESKLPGKKVESIELTRRLNDVIQNMRQFPSIIGKPGKPGYRVVAMARLEMTAGMLSMLDKDQRQDLIRDWEAGHRVLVSHRQFLRRQFKTLRRRGKMGLVIRATRAALNEHPGWAWSTLLLLAALGLCLYFMLT